MEVAPARARGIRIRALEKRYPETTDLFQTLRRPFRPSGEVAALRGIDLDLEPGRIYGLVGPNGAGKTTLLKVLAGLVSPTSGSVEVAGRRIEHDGLGSLGRRAGAERVGYVVSDERSFHWRLSVRENLRFFATLEGIGPRAERVEECLERVGLSAQAARPYRALSTGMRQRLALARGLLSEPRILLMDEATRSLDPLAAEELRELLRALFPPGSDRLLVWSTHQTLEVESLCTHLVVLREGRVAAEREIARGAPLADGVWLVRTRRPAPEELVNAIDGVELLRARGGLLELRLAEPNALDRIVDRIRDEGLGLVELRPGPWIEELLGEGNGRSSESGR